MKLRKAEIQRYILTVNLVIHSDLSIYQSNYEWWSRTEDGIRSKSSLPKRVKDESVWSLRTKLLIPIDLSTTRDKATHGKIENEALSRQRDPAQKCLLFPSHSLQAMLDACHRRTASWPCRTLLSDTHDSTRATLYSRPKGVILSPVIHNWGFFSPYNGTWVWFASGE